MGFIEMPQHRVRTSKRQVYHMGLARLDSGMESLGFAHPLGASPFPLSSCPWDTVSDLETPACCTQEKGKL